jgi:glutathione S-transferase
MDHASRQSLVLYGEPLWDSPYVFSAFVGLREKGLPFEVRIVDLDRGQQREPTFRSLSLTARVPCLAHGDFALSESQAIAEYLDEAFPAPAHPRLFPTDLRARARARQIMGWLRSDLMPLREERPTTTMFYAPATAPLSARAQAAADKLLGAAEALIPQGEGPLFGSWCLADAELAFMLHRLRGSADPVPARIARYAAAQWARPSVQAYVQQPRPASPGA